MIDEDKDPRRVGRDEMNLCEYPIASLTDHPPEGIKTLVFEDRQGRLTVIGSDAYGLPTALDNDVIVGLIHLTKLRNDFTNPAVTFSRYELLNLLGWPDRGQYYRRLKRRSSRPETHLQSGGAAHFFFAGRPRSLSVSFSKRIASLDLPKVKTSGGRGPFGSAILPQFAGFATPPPTYPLDTSVPINTIRGREITGNRPTSWGPDRGRFTLPALLPRTHRYAPPPL